VGEASAAILAAQGAAIREIWLQSGGRDQKIKADVRAAATETAGVSSSPSMAIRLRFLILTIQPSGSIPH